jgi:uncharacterized tellurite resistance protein B-like protein
MGLFDKFLGGQSSENVKLSPAEAFAGLVIATVGGDGHLSDEETRAANAVFGRMRLFGPISTDQFSAMIDRLVGYLNKHGADWLITKSTSALPEELHQTAFITAVDLVFADGSVEAAERALIERLQTTLNVPDEFAVKVVEVISIKNRG